MKSAGSPPAPDPNIGKAALKQADVGEAWLGFAKQAFVVSEARQQELDKLTREVAGLQIGTARDQLNYSREDRQRYKDKFQPVEDSFIKEATEYGDKTRQVQAAGEARADVIKAASDQRGINLRTAAGLGINPNSGRYEGINRATELGTSLAVANAENTARRTVRDRGLALKADVTNLGRGLPTQSAQAASVGLSAGSGAVGLHQGANAQYIASTGIMGQGFQGAAQGYAGQARTLNQQYSTQVQAYDSQNRANAASAQGFGSAIGGIVGLFASDEDKKTNKKKIPEGTGLAAVKKMPIEEWDYKPGVGDEGHHVGTYAQDFTEATGKGDGKTIAAQDAIGITMKAVQDLDSKITRIERAVGIKGAANSNSKKRKAAA